MPLKTESQQKRSPGRIRRAVALIQHDGPLRFAGQMACEHLLRPLLKIWLWLGGAVYAGVGLLILKPAADHLPARWAEAIARCFALAYALTPYWGLIKIVQMRRALGVGLLQGIVMTRDWFARPLLDAVILRRILGRRDDFTRWPVAQINRTLVAPLLASGQSFILATGHFSRKAAVPLFTEANISHKVHLVSNPPVKRTANPQTAWVRFHYGQMLAILPVLRHDMATINPGRPNLMAHLVGTLRAPGNAVAIMVDAPWRKNVRGGFARPFASRSNQWFATGAARLARAAQCPIVLCHPYLSETGTITFEWVRVIDPPAEQDAEADVRISNILLDDIEAAIGRHPTQYVIDFLGPRRLERLTRHWVEP